MKFISQQAGGDGRNVSALFDHAYNEGYAGAWSWQATGGDANSDDFETQALGLELLRNRNDQNRGGRVAIQLQ